MNFTLNFSIADEMNVLESDTNKLLRNYSVMECNSSIPKTKVTKKQFFFYF